MIMAKKFKKYRDPQDIIKSLSTKIASLEQTIILFDAFIGEQELDDELEEFLEEHGPEFDDDEEDDGLSIIIPGDE